MTLPLPAGLTDDPDRFLTLDAPFDLGTLTSLTLDGLLVRLTPTTWVPAGTPVDVGLKARALPPEPLPFVAASHRTAHWVWFLGGACPAGLEYTTIRRRRLRALPRTYTVYERNVPDEEIVLVAGRALTSPARTLYDVCAERVDALGDGLELREALVGLLRPAYLADRADFLAHLGRQHRRPGLARLRRAIDGVLDEEGRLLPDAPPVRSPLPVPAWEPEAAPAS